MIKIQLKKDSNFRKREELFKELEYRTTAFNRLFIIKIAEFFSKQVKGRYKKVKEEEAELIANNLIYAFVDYKKVPRKEKSEKRVVTTVAEEHYSAVIAGATPRGAQDINKDETILKVIANRGGVKQVSAGVFILVRFGPWHMDALPFIPDEAEATILFIKSTKDKVLAIKKNNNRQRSKVRMMLNKLKIKYSSRKDIEENLKGYDDLEYWVFRREFGLDGPKVRAWKPALDYIVNQGYMDVLRKDPKLLKILLDPNFKDYKNVDKGYKIIGEDDANKLINFQERIRG